MGRELGLRWWIQHRLFSFEPDSLQFYSDWQDSVSKSWLSGLSHSLASNEVYR
jgi:hypothetical protein